jgi:hypothetical protein
MRLAWFRTTRPDSGDLLDHLGLITQRLQRSHELEIVTEADAFDFAWKHGRQPYDLCVYETGRGRAHAFVWPYVLHYPGVAILDRPDVRDARVWRGSRAVVVFDAAVARSLEDEHAGARLRHVSMAMAAVDATPPPPTSQLRVGVLGRAPAGVVERAVDRAHSRGAALRVVQRLEDADVISALDWPPTAGPPAGALYAMASGRPAIVLEVEATAGWPALDPQTWQPRGFSSEPPIAISLDPRDEEHSLTLAFVRLASDRRLCTTLGAAGLAWWGRQATVERAIAEWERLLGEAASYTASPQRVVDGSENARAVLREIGAQVDFLPTDSQARS